MNSLTQVPPGTQILIGSAARRRREVERRVFSVFAGWSYTEVIAPMVDYFDVFARGMGSELEDKIYRFVDREGNILGLRPEFTSLLAKTAATRLGDEPKPLRLTYSGEVLRFEKPRGGQQREFAQIGIEHYGGSPFSSDVEILLVCMEALERLGVSDFQISIGSVEFFGGIVDRLNLPDDGVANLKELLNLKDRSGLERMVAGLDLDERRMDILRSIPHLTGGREVIEKARKMIRNDRSTAALEHLDNIYSVFERLGLDSRLSVDLGEIRGFDYYTGILFRAYVPGLGFEVASGGRYDGLLAQFGHDTPAVGFSFSLDRLEQIVDFAEPEPPTDMVSTDSVVGYEEAVRLRKAGKTVKLCS